MKIRQLFLKAFGPFTDATLRLFRPSAHPPDLTGPNEAGKSSALRALGDLRYGIHARSTDDFIHAFKDMLLAGTFEDAAGQVHALARRKGTREHPDAGRPGRRACRSRTAPCRPMCNWP